MTHNCELVNCGWVVQGFTCTYFKLTMCLQYYTKPCVTSYVSRGHQSLSPTAETCPAVDMSETCNGLYPENSPTFPRIVFQLEMMFSNRKTTLCGTVETTRSIEPDCTCIILMEKINLLLNIVKLAQTVDENYQCKKRKNCNILSRKIKISIIMFKNKQTNE